jgi:fibronectin type 3 domain-containing protein
MDHAVLIVGWDDSLPHAGGKGAWICKNSWGTLWGDNGFFYIAYGSARIGQITSYYESFKNYDDQENLYYYDEGGWSDSYGFPSSTTAWGLVKFIAAKDECIQAVDFWVTIYHLSYTIFIYDSFDGNNVSNLLHSQSGTIDSGGGYFSIPLSSPVCVSKGDDFVVVVKFTCTSGYTYTVPTDDVNTYFPIENGKCFISPDGSPGSWTDMGAKYNRDIGIRARAKSTAAEPPVPPSDLAATAAACDHIHLSWYDNSDNEAGYKIERSENGVDFAPVGTVGTNSSSYEDTGLKEAQTYWYRLKAYNSAGDSSYSNIDSALTPVCSGLPLPPSSLTAQVLDCHQVDLTWSDNSDNETQFHLERSPDGSSFLEIAAVGADLTFYRDATVQEDRTYYYRVRAGNETGYSAYSNSASGMIPACPVTPPAGPDSLAVTAAACDQIRLSWSDKSDNEDGFKIERSENGISFVLVATAAIDSITYIDTGLVEDKSYWFRLRAYNSGGDSSYSNTGSAMTPVCPRPPQSPSALTAQAVDCRQADLTWSDNSANETQFHIERSSDGAVFLEIAAAGPGITSYKDNAVQEGRTYYYRVRAGNEIGFSGYSNTASVGMPTCPGTIPAAPSGFITIARSKTSISLAWTDNAANEEGFRIYRRASKSAFGLIATLAPDVVSYTDGTVKSRTTYLYKVCAFNAYGETCSREMTVRTK